jgi:hypothetical protein
VVKVATAEKLTAVVIGNVNQRTAALSGCHAEIATRRRRTAPRITKSVAMTIAGRSCSPRGVPIPTQLIPFNSESASRKNRLDLISGV